MIDLYYAGTPNGQKMTLCLEELGLPYRLNRIALMKGEQFAPDFLKISPNNKIPAIVDHAPAYGGVPIAIFESGAMPQYLAENTTWQKDYYKAGNERYLRRLYYAGS